MKARLRKLAVAAGLAALGLGIGLVLAEGLLRLLRLAPTDGVATVTERDFRRIPGIFEPGQSVLDERIVELPHRVNVNSLGYRGEDFPAAKPQEETRILMLGDSFTYGDYVDDDETLPAALEDELNELCTGRVRTVNAGLGGSTIEGHFHLGVRGLAIEPDVAVLTFSENDLQDLAGPTLWTRLAGNRAVKSRFPLGLVYPVLRNTALWNLALKVRGAAGLRRRVQATSGEDGAEVVDAGEEGQGAATRIAELRERYAEGLAAVRDTLAAHGVPLVLAAYPGLQVVDEGQTNERITWVLGVADSLGIPAVDFVPPLLATGLGSYDLYLLPHDGHPRPFAYRTVAEALGRRLIEDGFLDAGCTARPVAQGA